MDRGLADRARAARADAPSGDADPVAGIAGASPDDPGVRGSAFGRLVATHRSCDSRELAAQARILSELERLDRPCDETADPVHVTASAIVVGNRGTILHRHKRLGRWLQPGGHIDPGETPASASLRECQEETGLTLAHPSAGPLLVHLDVHESANGHTHLDLRYLILGPDDDPNPPPGESPVARWCSWEEAEGLADEALIGALHSARRAWERIHGKTGRS